MSSVDSIKTPDTLVVGGERVRVIGIRAPALGDLYYSAAMQFASDHLKGRDVELVPDPTQDDIDPFDRLLRYVMVDGRNYSVMITRAGLAVPYFSRPAVTRLRNIRRAHQAAQAAKIGMWS